MHARSLTAGVCVFLSVSAGSQASTYEWIEWQGHRYAASLEWQSWEQANAAAESMGAYLVVINSQEEDQFLRNAIVDPLWGDFWIGAIQSEAAQEPDGSWSWVNGDPWSYANWHENEPDNNNNARVAFIGSHEIGWSDEIGDTPYYAIFEAEAGPIPTVSEWGVVVMLLGLSVAATLVFHRVRQPAVT